MMGQRSGVGFAVALATLVPSAAVAQALPSCSDPTMFPNPIYLTGSSSFEPAAGLMAIKLGALTGVDKVTLVYKATSSCDGPTAVRDNVTLTGNADYWTLDPDLMMAPVKHACALDVGQKADVGVSDLFYESCPGNSLPLPTFLIDVRAAVLPVAFVVPEANTTVTNLTAAEAQSIWGCGAASKVPPFDSEVGIQQRSFASGTQGVVAAVIGVPPGAFKGNPNASSSDLVASLLAVPSSPAAIGFVLADAYDARRTVLNALAFRAFGQTRAFYPDASFETFDKRNVREGRYFVWGYVHLFAAANAGTITNPKAARLIGLITGTSSTPAFDPTSILAQADLVPTCAMRVARDREGGPLRPSTPTSPCGCAWERLVTGTAVPAGCTACVNDFDCTGGKHCSNRFCE